MVKLNKIYTKSGDDGSTGLVGGTRVQKNSIRVEAYGTVDEANAALGIAITHLAGETKAALEQVQHDLFDVGADLATPLAPDEAEGAALRVQPNQTERLESLIDDANERLAPLTSFVLPGGASASAALHLARTVTRRAERVVVSLLESEPDATNPETVRYLNRLSDLLFVLARLENDEGRSDVLWIPGSGRNADKDDPSQ